MKLARLSYRNLRRHRLRNVLTALGVGLAILTFAILRTLIGAWYAAADQAAPDRLITRNAVSLTFALPLAYKERIAQVEGVQGVSWANWFGGIYIDKKNFFPQFGTDLESYFALYPEYEVDPAQWAQAVSERNAAVAGRKLADRYGWEVGDVIPITGAIYPGEYEFKLRAIYDGTSPTTDETQFFFHWTYLDEMMKKELPMAAGNVGVYVIQVADPSQVARVSGRVDALFENSLAATLTETEKAFQLSFVSMSGAIISAIQVVSILIVGIVLLVLANTMAMAARERTKEFAVLKTLGFRAGHIALAVAGESLLIALAGGRLRPGRALPDRGRARHEHVGLLPRAHGRARHRGLVGRHRVDRGQHRRPRARLAGRLGAGGGRGSGG